MGLVKKQKTTTKSKPTSPPPKKTPKKPNQKKNCPLSLFPKALCSLVVTSQVVFNCVTQPLTRDVLLLHIIEIIFSYLERISWSKCFQVCQKYQASGVHGSLMAVAVPINTQEGQHMAPEPSRTFCISSCKGMTAARAPVPVCKGVNPASFSGIRAAHAQKQFNLGQVHRGKPQVFTTVCESGEKCSH